MSRWLWIVLAVAALARLHLQMAAHPPYSGLDELHHVARLAFTLQEGRSPTMREPSLPPYLRASMKGEGGLPHSFEALGARWPQAVAERSDLLADRPLTAADRRPYEGANYEAQQASLYYLVAAPLARLLPVRTPLAELRLWRGFSLFCALVTVLATASIGWRVAGHAGLLAAALLVSLPTWLTLVVRASNDAFACALIASAVAVTLHAPSSRRGHLAEGLLWAGAFAAKLYSWPVAVVLPFLWRMQRAPLRRIVTVVVLGTLAVVITLIDLAMRTNNPLGLFAFDRPPAPAAPAAIDYAQMLRVLVASFAWTSATHWNALRPLAIALYLGPLVLIVAWVLARNWREHRPLLALSGIAVVTFALAQAVNAAGYIRIARATGVSVPAGGKEGWYWYALAPLLIGVVLAIVLRRLPLAAVAAVVLWIVAWDVFIHEGALFQDFAGYTSSTAHDLFFRWGGRTLPFARDLDLERVSVGPGVQCMLLDRIVHLAALGIVTAGCGRNR
ncbi:MAG TPA: hypothetical protein VM779_00240 [Thermoanaerobaculia bacterium]|nr:hypothetical protein [Thermoanaerobaculia bacterium]